MSYPTIKIRPSEFEQSRLVLGEPKINPTTGGQMRNVLYNHPTDGKCRFALQTPSLKSLFGMKTNQFDENSPSKTDLTVSLMGMDDDPKIMELFNVFKNLDDYMKAFASENSQSLFKKKCSDEVIQDKYCEMVKYSKDKETGEIMTKYAPTLKFKVPKHNSTGEITTEVYDHTKTPVENVEEVLGQKGLTLKMLVNPCVFWASGGKFGLNWEVKQVKVDKSSAIKGYAFMTDSDDEEEEEEDASLPVSDDDIAEICNETSAIQVDNDEDSTIFDNQPSDDSDGKSKKKGGSRKKK
jgi:hypothetical protein